MKLKKAAQRTAVSSSAWPKGKLTMDKNELITAISAAFMIFFILGWVARMGYGRLRHINSANVDKIDDLATRLHDAEEQRDDAVTHLHQRERDLINKAAQAEAELDAAMQGLGSARRETEALRRQLNDVQGD
jgi:F0F1-type ATP synthase membrane subunit b/b'